MSTTTKENSYAKNLITGVKKIYKDGEDYRATSKRVNQPANIAQFDLQQLMFSASKYTLIWTLLKAGLSVSGIKSRNTLVKSIAYHLIDAQVPTPDQLSDGLNKSELHKYVAKGNRTIQHLIHDYANDECFIVAKHDGAYRHVTDNDVQNVFDYILDSVNVLLGFRREHELLAHIVAHII